MLFTLTASYSLTANESTKAKCVQNFSRSIKNALYGNYSAAGHCTYPDGTRSASSLTCYDPNCCDLYLKGSHTKNDKQYKTWRHIGQLNCKDSNYHNKIYINGKDSNQPSHLTINTNIAETHGDNSPATIVNNSPGTTLNTPTSDIWTIITVVVALIGVIVAVIFGLFSVGVLKRRPRKNKEIVENSDIEHP